MHCCGTVCVRLLRPGRVQQVCALGRTRCFEEQSAAGELTPATRQPKRRPQRDCRRRPTAHLDGGAARDGQRDECIVTAAVIDEDDHVPLRGPGFGVLSARPDGEDRPSRGEGDSRASATSSADSFARSTGGRPRLAIVRAPAPRLSGSAAARRRRYRRARGSPISSSWDCCRPWPGRSMSSCEPTPACRPCCLDIAIASLPTVALHVAAHARVARRRLGRRGPRPRRQRRKFANLRVGQISIQLSAFADPRLGPASPRSTASRATVRAASMMLIDSAGPRWSARSRFVVPVVRRALAGAPRRSASRPAGGRRTGCWPRSGGHRHRAVRVCRSDFGGPSAPKRRASRTAGAPSSYSAATEASGRKASCAQSAPQSVGLRSRTRHARLSFLARRRGRSHRRHHPYDAELPRAARRPSPHGQLPRAPPR